MKSLYTGIAALWMLAACQPSGLKITARTPVSLNEISGHTSINGGRTVWAINDGGNPAHLYELDSAANILRILPLINTQNIDWEAITADPVGNLYVCDIGNNFNNRKNLTIYKISNPSFGRQDSARTTPVFFSYSTQTAFPPPKPALNFDAEACVWLRDTLWIFSKNRTRPYTGYTYLHALPAAPGTWTTTLADSFHTGKAAKYQGWVTDAALSPNGKRLALLCTGCVWVFEVRPGESLLRYPLKRYDFPLLTQKEGVHFRNDSLLIISDEWSAMLQRGGCWYQLPLR